MSGFVVFGGTTEGRMLAEAFCGKEMELHICVATEYGEALLPGGTNIHIHRGRMETEEIKALLRQTEADFCINAAHPYAEIVTENIYEACTGTGIPYIRLLREDEPSDTLEMEKDHTIYVGSIEEAAAYLNGTKGNILLTTGSKDLEKYKIITDYRKRCFVRVLPAASVMEKCRELGFEGRNLIGMQGPFSEELNHAMIRHTDAKWMVTKSSGKEGGYKEKCDAALQAGIHILVVGRPRQKNINEMSFRDTVGYIENYYRGGTNTIYLTGMGPGSAACVTEEVWKCLRDSDCLIGSERILHITAEAGCPELSSKPSFTSYKKEEITAFLRRNHYKRAAILYSGDIGFYSGARGMKEYLQKNIPGCIVKTVSGISSCVYFMNRLQLPWQDAKLVSIHGQKKDLIPIISCNEKVCVLLGDKTDVSGICRRLQQLAMNNIRITVGERLSYKDERIRSGYPLDWVGKECDTLAAALFENPSPMHRSTVPGIKDDRFIRGKVPMTKQEIRILSLAKLGLHRNSILYDIGAGTGSVSIEAARLINEGTVYAVERNQEGIRLIQENIRCFGLNNIHVVEGTAPDCLRDRTELKPPTEVFIGGSGGKLAETVRYFHELNRKVRFVINAITIETLAEAVRISREYVQFKDMEILHISAARSKETGSCHMMLSENPVYIISFGGEESHGE